MSKDVLIITNDSGESQEIYYAKHRFLEAGWKSLLAATRRRALHVVLQDFDPDWNIYVEKPGYRIDVDLAFGRVKVRDFAAVLLLGGRAQEFCGTTRR